MMNLEVQWIDLPIAGPTYSGPTFSFKYYIILYRYTPTWILGYTVSQITTGVYYVWQKCISLWLVIYSKDIINGNMCNRSLLSWYMNYVLNKIIHEKPRNKISIKSSWTDSSYFRQNDKHMDDKLNSMLFLLIHPLFAYYCGTAEHLYWLWTQISHSLGYILSI